MRLLQYHWRFLRKSTSDDVYDVEHKKREGCAKNLHHHLSFHTNFCFSSLSLLYLLSLSLFPHLRRDRGTFCKEREKEERVGIPVSVCRLVFSSNLTESGMNPGSSSLGCPDTISISLSFLSYPFFFLSFCFSVTS